MLTLLHIENIAVVESADISFDRGFNVLTGETGAGKSIIIDAISAILGERAYRELIRTGTEKAFVSAVFDGVPELPWFETYGVPFEEELLIQREIFLDGKNLCRVNGRGVTVSQLKALGRSLITIHGQHDSQQLFDEQTHLGLLDAFAADGEQLSVYAAAWERVRACRDELERLSMDESEKARRQEMLQFQIKELERARLQPGEDEALEQRQKLLMNGEKLSAALSEAVTALFGDEDSRGSAELLDEALGALGGALRYDEALRGPHDRLRELSFALADAGEELRDYRDRLGDSEAELDEIGARLDLIHRLKRKYGASCAEMLDYLARARTELDDIIFADEKIRQAKKALEAAENAALVLARELHALRAEAAAELERRVCRELAELNMPGVRFVCQFQETPLGPEGIDGLRFLMSANAGEAVKPLARVASGGELARIMLAMKNVMAAQDQIATMIFDEVDAGVSGRAAQKVAEKLRSVARGRQVLCVTHLPQIAALAEHHLLISKSQRQGRTYTQVDALDRGGRIEELARLIGGAQITETTLKSAEEMLVL
ncbi:MAG: DNA repair protein RecN [Oscillospiraceae bacterium]|nr:DNA repair protein RecN [Oscillospiraceae bacterium]